MNALEIHTREVKQLDTRYKQVDSYVDGLGIHADLATPLKASMKFEIVSELQSRSRGLVNLFIGEEHVKIDTEIREAKEAAQKVALVADLLELIRQINIDTPNSIVVAAPPYTIDQLRGLIREFEKKPKNP